MATFTDDFNRSNSSDLGANWVEVSGDWSIVSSELSPGNAGGTVILRAAGAMDSDNNYAQVTIAATTAASQGVWCRGNANISSGYLFRNDGTSWDLFSVVGGSFTLIGTYSAPAAPGDVAKVQANGSTITCYVNAVERINVTNSAVATGTSVGIRSESTSSLRYDNFTGSDIASTIQGVATGNLGGLTGLAIGTRVVHGVATGSLGGLTGEAQGSVLVVAPVGSWDTLTGMIQEAADWVRSKVSEPPQQCPYDQTPLVGGPDGTLFCPWDGDYIWPDDGRIEL